MKKKYLFIATLAASVGFLSFQSTSVAEFGRLSANIHKQSGGGQTALTGAPGENNCTQCHLGTPPQDGTAQNILNVLDGVNPVTSYTPGNSYTVTLTLTSDPAKKGFSAVALDPTNTNAGTFVGDGAFGGTQDFTSATRHYVSHTATSNTSAQSAWLWTWNAPATDVGNVTFYVASNEANNNGTTTGDVIYLSQHVINSTAGIEENNVETSFVAGYSASNRQVVVDFTSFTIGEMALNLVDMNGKSVYFQKLGTSEIGENKELIKLPAEIEAGMYVVHFFVGNNPMSAKILVQ